MDLSAVAEVAVPGTAVLQLVNFVPSRPSYVSYLYAEAGGLVRLPYAHHLASNRRSAMIAPPVLEREDTMSLEEKLRRERERATHIGVTRYQWYLSGAAPGASRQPALLIPLQGNLYVAAPDLPEPSPQSMDTDGGIASAAPSGLVCVYDKATLDGQGAIDPKVAPGGLLASFVAGGEVHVVDLPPSGCFEGWSAASPRRLTFDADGRSGVTNGLADYVAQEEMERSAGYWWAPGARAARMAFTQVDEGHIPVFRIMHSGSEEPCAPGVSQEDHRYPFAGAANPAVRLGVLDLDTLDPQGRPRVTWLDLSVGGAADAEMYIARVQWCDDRRLLVQTQDRAQRTLDLLLCDAATGEAQLLLRETSDVWINLHDSLRVLPRCVAPAGPEGAGALAPGSFSFLWASERSGFMHLYLYTYVGGSEPASLIGPVTSGEWCVEGIAGLSVDAEQVFVVGNADSPLERHLYCCLLPLAAGDAPSALLRLTAPGAMHTVVAAPRLNRFVVTRSAPDRPPLTQVLEVRGGVGALRQAIASRSSGALPSKRPREPEAGSGPLSGVRPEGWGGNGAALLGGEDLLRSALPAEGALHDAMEPRVERLGDAIRPPEFLRIPIEDAPPGGTGPGGPLHPYLMAALYRPDADVHGPGPYPTVVAVYGGPHVQRVQGSWRASVDMRAQYLRAKGFAVLKCDNRGSFRRGLGFEAPILRAMGSVEVEDQVRAVRHLVRGGVCDARRVGIYGWSYGGYMSAMCLCKAPEVFRAAVAGAPVTSWDGYDTHYTERYMGLPQEEPEAYAAASVLEQAGGMRSHQRLMLVHGLIDENVHFRHTARLLNKLIEHHANYDLVLFPDERHLPRKPSDRVYMEQRIVEFLIANVMNAGLGVDAVPSQAHL